MAKRKKTKHKLQEEFEDTKGAIRIHISKNRQHNGQKKKDKRTNNVKGMEMVEMFCKYLLSHNSWQLLGCFSLCPTRRISALMKNNHPHECANTDYSFNVFRNAYNKFLYKVCNTIHYHRY
jgi:hypothetical protein